MNCSPYLVLKAVQTREATLETTFITCPQHQRKLLNVKLWTHWSYFWEIIRQNKVPLDNVHKTKKKIGRNSYYIFFSFLLVLWERKSPSLQCLHHSFLSLRKQRFHCDFDASIKHNYFAKWKKTEHERILMHLFSN